MHLHIGFNCNWVLNFQGQISHVHGCPGHPAISFSSSFL